MSVAVDLVEGTAIALSGVAVVLAACVWASTRSWQPAWAVLLELLLAAGLLWLTTASTWSAIATAAVIVALRLLVRAGSRPTP